MVQWCDHKHGADPLASVAMRHRDRDRLGLPEDLSGTGAMAQAFSRRARQSTAMPTSRKRH